MQSSKSKFLGIYVIGLALGLMSAFVLSGLGNFNASAQMTNSTTNSTTSNSTATSNSTSLTANNSTVTAQANSTATAPANGTSSNTTTTAATSNNVLSGVSLKGQISSVQTNSSGMPTWVQAGVFVLRGTSSSNGTQSTQLYARFEMIKPDGTAMHNHLVYAFKTTNSSSQNSTMTIQGTATVTMPGGPVKDVPITIKVFNQKLIAIWIGPDKVNNHFGSGPVYGTVTKPSRGVMAEMNSMKG